MTKVRDAMDSEPSGKAMTTTRWMWTEEGEARDVDGDRLEPLSQFGHGVENEVMTSRGERERERKMKEREGGLVGEGRAGGGGECKSLCLCLDIQMTAVELCWPRGGVPLNMAAGDLLSMAAVLPHDLSLMMFAPALDGSDWIWNSHFCEVQGRKRDRRTLKEARTMERYQRLDRIWQKQRCRAFMRKAISPSNQNDIKPASPLPPQRDDNTSSEVRAPSSESHTYARLDNVAFMPLYL
ncbi:hypothetical protein F5148DRAFT_1369952 [Russula earlei]|uniref:Uncharacterized protein n=1 Tax=Russula earlei TaxID=71964 RepID=A0ACC0U0V5_9AGAM|nr:hypothetical protein F5148DRAFT_1369952 [Russula earlei]